MIDNFYPLQRGTVNLGKVFLKFLVKGQSFKLAPLVGRDTDKHFPVTNGVVDVVIPNLQPTLRDGKAAVHEDGSFLFIMFIFSKLFV